ncbi:MAG: hypothetical protein AAF628_10300 [Planctomycetota bacterium]
MTSEVRGIPAAATATVMSLGRSDLFLGPLELPLSLFFAGMPGCWLHHDSVLFDPAITIAGTTGRYDLMIPNRPSLAGVTLYLQAWVAAPGATPAGAITSNGAALEIGEAVPR